MRGMLYRTFLVTAYLSFNSICFAGIAADPKVLLGETLFFDSYLSSPKGQACASCHAPDAGWTGPDQTINLHGAVYEGAVVGRFGNRKPPSAGYAPFAPNFHREASGAFIGGNFWDGRATGNKLGNPAADQAQGPFLNPLEHNIASPHAFCHLVKESKYAKRKTGWSYEKLFERAFGHDALNCSDDINGTYDRAALAISAYEASPKVSAFSSKFDAYLNGTANLTEQEQKGMELFAGKGKCAACHSMASGTNGEPPLFTDFAYDNLGTPRNPENPFYQMPATYNPAGSAWVDPGLGGYLAGTPDFFQFAAENYGKQKVPTLRNVDKRPFLGFVKAYTHNGAFKSLEEVVHFYNTRDVYPDCTSVSAPARGINCWPAPEVSANVNRAEMGNLGLSAEEETAVVAFLKTLTDGYR